MTEIRDQRSEVFYVRPGGDDRRDGKSKKNAFRTVKRAIRACRGLKPRPIVVLLTSDLCPLITGEGSRG